MGPEDQHEQPFDKEEYEKWMTDAGKIRRLRMALAVLMKLVEDGVLVRNTSNDGCLADYVHQSVALTLALKQAQDVLNDGREGTRTGQGRRDEA